tara:strand:- start:6529 stop:6798 length:270 start_codon:yes stop_codon:yes gene_type:complete
MNVHFHTRLADGNCPAGTTVSKKAQLPAGDFRITEYCWGKVTLWFVDADQFTADQRQASYLAYRQQPDPVCGCGKTSEGICRRCGADMG